VLLADDHTLILEGFRFVLGDECDLVGCAHDGVSLVDAAIRLKPDIVLLDISMPGQSGIAAARQIIDVLPSVRVIFVTMHANPSYFRAAMAAGGMGYVLKTCVRDDLLVAVRRVLDGYRYVTPGFADLDAGSDKPSSAEALTDRQREILSLIATGNTAKEMASALHVSVQTVAFHKYRIMNKLSLRTTAELTRYALQEGIVGP